ncbi:uncharacterized protein AMSG_00127 [Thecamonas trahens ATCC 50062]|uniref:Uncharacterized protein n=1 Tax=Thecamonas trahens ATCC 50062 TaxID=461836 RepID=A0A0L0D0V7_THETB|nr:hypothetical protein AMSG_00127 [Thecamonas trahens ATCC 50062]KNC46009.1 hypothetical protein AMSG_00127 [Thecamonas trahens ATCC 50062]|eukprot:XP_013762989.1 hypothetical protein AMSG_00127 [Thecamonas trahens ATCC 50062]
MYTGAWIAAVALVVAVFGAGCCEGKLHEVNGELYAPTPQGYMLARCIREVASGTHVTEDGRGRMVLTAKDGSVEVMECNTDGGRIPMLLSKSQMAAARAGNKRDSDGFGGYDGWQAFTSYEYEAGLDVFVGDISTPNGKPKREPEVLFIFTGLQNVNWIPKVDPEPRVFDIIQPVLQYPATAVLGGSDDDPVEFGSSWGVRSWYVTIHSGAVYSKVALLDEGDVVFGNMTRTGSEAFYVGSTNKANGETVAITVSHPRLATQPWAYNTLETYGAPSCEYLPDAPSLFTNLVLAKGSTKVTASWANHVSPSQTCAGSKCVIVDPATVTIDMGQ